MICVYNSDVTHDDPSTHVTDAGGGWMWVIIERIIDGHLMFNRPRHDKYFQGPT